MGGIFSRIRKRNADTSVPACTEGVEPGTIILYDTGMRKVMLEPDGTILKIGAHVSPAEAAALRVAFEAGLPAPPLHDVFNSNDEVGIRMGYVQGQTLEKLWPGMSHAQKKNVAEQLREIVTQMRELKPPPHYIGCCDGTGVRDTRVRFTYSGPKCSDEAEFNDYLGSSLFRQIPSLLRTSLLSQLQTDHRIVFTHGDLTPRNILMQDDKISGVVDWEDGGWYPEYWELVKFFERPAEGDWKEFANIVFSEIYQNELVTYTAMSKWRNP